MVSHHLYGAYKASLALCVRAKLVDAKPIRLPPRHRTWLSFKFFPCVPRGRRYLIGICTRRMNTVREPPHRIELWPYPYHGYVLPLAL